MSCPAKVGAKRGVICGMGKPAKASRAADDHRRRSTSSYEAGRQLLLALGGPGQISREDEELLREVGARVGLVPVKR